MILVEGPDGAGKSTLVDDLAQEFDLLIGERAAKDRDHLYETTRQDTYTALSEAVNGHTSARIWDRLFFSEFAYYDLTGRTCEFTSEDQMFVPEVIKALRCPVIFCMPPFEVVEANALKDDQMDGVKENLTLIYRRYEAMLNPADAASTLVPNNRVIYDYTGKTPATFSKDSIRDLVDTYLSMRKRREWR